MPTLTKNKKIIIGLVSVFLVLGVVFILSAPSARALGWLDLVSGAGSFVGSLLAWVAYFILWLFSRLISVAAFLLQAVFTIEESTGFTKVTVVTTGWQITRGLSNMFFALILLFMAFDTILQTNKFPIKTILPKLILAALTINFSLVLCGVIIDFSQILTRYFIDAAGGPSHSIADQLANGLNIAKVFQTPTNGLDTDASVQTILGGGTAGLLALFGTLAFGIVIILIAAFAIGAGAILMLVRLVSLWVLLITAPLAWLAMIAPLPGLSSLTGDWWKKFFQWTFFAPIYAFFIYLAVLVASTPIFSLTQTAAQKKVTGSIFINSFLSPDNGLSLLMQYIVIIIILLTGLKTAQSSGLAGADKVIKGAKALAGVGGKFVERWAAKGAEKEGTGGWARFRRGTSYLAPTPWKEAWKKRSAQKEREAMPVATGARQDLLNRILPGWEKTDYRARAVRQREAEERKDIISANAPELVAQFMLAEKNGNAPKMGAYTQNLANQNDLNELFRELQKKFKDLDFSMSAEGMINLVDHVLAPKMGQNEANRLGHDLSRILEGKGQWVGRPFTYAYDPKTKTGQYEKVSTIDPKTKETKKMEYYDAKEKKTKTRDMTVADVARSAASGEWSKMDPQPQIYTTARFSFYKETYNKETGATEGYELTEDGRRKLSTLDFNNANRWHTQTKLMVMFKNPEELKDLNGELYKRTLDSMGTTTKNMLPAELKNYIDYQADSVPTVTQEEKDKLMKLVNETGKRLLEEDKEKEEKKKKEKKE